MHYGENKIFQVKSCKHLGGNITRNRDVTEQVLGKTGKAAMVSKQLRDVIYMTVHSQTRIYKRCVRPILTGRGETRIGAKEPNKY